MNYQGKEVLRIWDFVTDFEQWKKDNLYSLPLIGKMAQYSPFGHLIGIIEKIENTDFGKVVKCFLQALHGINRAFNSYTYSDLILAADQQLNSLTFTKNEASLFNRSLLADKYLDKDFLNLQIGEKSINIPEFIFPTFLQEWITDAKNTVISSLDTVKKLINEVLNNLEKYGKKFLNSLKNKKKKIEEVLSKWGDEKQSIRSLILPPEQIFQSKSAIILVPSIAGTLTTIGGLATFFLSLMGIGITGIGVALKHFVTSIVSNFFTSSGAIVSRYMAAAILRFNETVLPAIFQKTGMAGTAWCYLMQFALPVLFSALLIITLIKSKLTIGNHLYIYGDGDSQLTVLDDLDENNLLSHAEVNQVLTEKKLSQLSGKSYAEYYGFSVNYKNEIVYALDLNTDKFLSNGPQLFHKYFTSVNEPIYN